MKKLENQNLERIRNLLNSYHTLSRTELAQLKKDLVNLTDEQQEFLADNEIEMLQENLGYVREAVDSEEEHNAYLKQSRKLQAISKVVWPAVERQYEKYNSKTVWETLEESTTEMLEAYKRKVLVVPSHSFKDADRLEQLDFVEALLKKRYAS